MSGPAVRLLAGAWRNQVGSTLPMVALGLMVTLTAAALAADLGRAHVLRAELQTTADAAALAAAARLPDVKAAQAAAIAYARKNMAPEAYGEVLLPEDIAFGTWQPKSRELKPSDLATAVQVTPRLSVDHGNAMDTFFGGALGVDVVEIEASATAGRRSPSCIVVLDPSQSQAMNLKSKGQVETEECSIQVNSNQDDALSVGPNGVITAGTICVTGGADIGNKGSVTPTPIENCPASPDPLVATPEPLTGGCDYTNASYKKTAATLAPGVYCGGLEIGVHAEIELQPGLYVIEDGPLAVESSASVTGAGVTFYLTGTTALIRFKSQASLSLSAPEDGDLAGILFFQDRAFGGAHEWDSKQPMELVGTIYLPNGTLSSKSSSAITPNGSCNVMIVRTLDFQSKSGVSIDLASSDCRKRLPKGLRGAVVLLD